ncbi:hypothetical protein C8F01DRAFT_1183220 [Mycena amicta]|nr:hypothetical protein C8F01DRAFT_1183220 [Mycena amicta]
MVQNVPQIASAFRPSELLGAKDTIWGFLSPFLYGGFAQIMFLVCNAPEMQAANLPSDIAVARTKIEKFFSETNHGSSRVFDWVVAGKLVALFDELFQKHFATTDKVFQRSFGQDTSEDYQTAYRAFYNEARKEIGVRFDSAMVAKFKLVFGSAALMSGFPFVPDVRVPGLCPSSMKALMKVFNEQSGFLTLLVSWFVPVLWDIQYKQRSKLERDADGNQIIPSATCILLHHLAYFQDFRGPDMHRQTENWMRSGVDNENLIYWTSWSGAVVVEEDAGRAFTSIILHVLNNRHMLTAHKAKITEVVAALKKDALSGAALAPASLDILIATIKIWRATARDQTKHFTNVRPMAASIQTRFQQVPKSSWYDQDEANPLGVRAFRNGFIYSHVNWFSQGTGNRNNTEKVWRRYCNSIFCHANAMGDHVVGKLLTEGKHIAILAALQSIQSRVSQETGFKSFTSWVDVPEHVQRQIDTHVAGPAAETNDNLGKAQVDADATAVLTAQIVQLIKTISSVTGVQVDANALVNGLGDKSESVANTGLKRYSEILPVPAAMASGSKPAQADEAVDKGGARAKRRDPYDSSDADEQGDEDEDGDGDKEQGPQRKKMKVNVILSSDSDSEEV